MVSIREACAEADRRVHTSHAGAVQALLAAGVPFKLACRYVMALARYHRVTRRALRVFMMKDYTR